MAAGDMLVDVDYGVEFNGWAATGVSPKLTGLDGVESSPELRNGNQSRGHAHGAIVGPLAASTRIVTVEVTMHGAPSSLREQVDELAAATALADVEQPLVWVAGFADPRRVAARCIGRALPVDQQFAHGKAVAVLQFEATDPRVYGNVQRSGSTAAGTSSGGLALPHGFPHGFGTATPGTIAVTNDGTSPAPWQATLTGPLTSPGVSLVGTDGDVELAGFTLADGETLELDSLERSVLLNGSASRYGSLSVRSWFHLPAGGSTVQMSATSGTGTLELRWRDTRL